LGLDPDDSRDRLAGVFVCTAVEGDGLDETYRPEARAPLGPGETRRAGLESRVAEN
jgi:hypothetical protein